MNIPEYIRDYFEYYPTRDDEWLALFEMEIGNQVDLCIDSLKSEDTGETKKRANFIRELERLARELRDFGVTPLSLTPNEISLTSDNLPGGKLYIVEYRHKHGVDVFPMFSLRHPAGSPGLRAELLMRGFDRNNSDEDVNISGPFDAIIGWEE